LFGLKILSTHRIPRNYGICKPVIVARNRISLRLEAQSASQTLQRFVLASFSVTTKLIFLESNLRDEDSTHSTQ
jgi:hypothetical protein